MLNPSNSAPTAKNIYIHRETCIRMFRAIVSVVAKKKSKIA